MLTRAPGPSASTRAGGAADNAFQLHSSSKRAARGAHLRVGPIILSVEERSERLAEALVSLGEGYTAPSEAVSGLHRAKVELYDHPEPAPTLGARDPKFTYSDVSSSYLSSNALVHLALTLGSAETTLRAGVRPQQKTGGLFPGYLLRMVTTAALVQAGALLVHGCAMVSPKGQGVLFLGASGDGKTTMTRRLPGWRVLADDTVSIEGMNEPGGIWVRGTPYAGSEGLPRSGDRAPLTKLMVLQPRAATLDVASLDSAQAFQALLQRIFCPFVDGPLPLKIVDLASGVAGRVPAFRLASNLSHDLSVELEQGTH